MNTFDDNQEKEEEAIESFKLRARRFLSLFHLPFSDLLIDF